LVVVSKTRTQCASREQFSFVIAGLDPAIHAEEQLAADSRQRLIRRKSAWTTGSSPAVTQPAAEKMCAASTVSGHSSVDRPAAARVRRAIAAIELV
jgi:hypothetical protein